MKHFFLNFVGTIPTTAQPHNRTTAQPHNRNNFWLVKLASFAIIIFLLSKTVVIAQTRCGYVSDINDPPILGPPTPVDDCNLPVAVFPVVFHIFLEDGEPIPTDLTPTAFEGIMQHLNFIYRSSNSLLENNIDSRIAFRLAAIDPQGVCMETPGLNYVNVGAGAATFSNLDEAETNMPILQPLWWDEVDGTDNDPTYRYINVYIVKQLNSGGSVYGSAYDVNTVAINRNRIVATSNQPLGFYPDLAHEIGHLLSLFHTFQGFDCSQVNCTDGDNICDTSPHAATCPNLPNSCTDNGKVLYPPNPTLNIMTYCDAAFKITLDQSNRMNYWNVNNETKVLMMADENLTNTGVPNIEVLPGNRIVSGKTVTFTAALGTLPATAFTWSGSFFTSVNSNTLSHTFLTPGIYEILLTTVIDTECSREDKITITVDDPLLDHDPDVNVQGIYDANDNYNSYHRIISGQVVFANLQTKINGAIVVQNGGELTIDGGEYEFSEKGAIVVMPGGKLIVKGYYKNPTILRGDACDNTLWTGIIAIGNGAIAAPTENTSPDHGIVIFQTDFVGTGFSNSFVVQDALRGVSCFSCILEANNVLFLNNAFDVFAYNTSGYDSDIKHRINLTACKFITDENYNGPENTKFIQGAAFTDANLPMHVYLGYMNVLTTASNVKFCRFEDKRTPIYPHRPKGIIAVHSSVRIGQPPILSNNEFYNLFEAIGIYACPDPASTSIRQNLFENCRQNVVIKNSSAPDLRKLKMSNIPDGIDPNMINYYTPLGIWLEQVDMATVNDCNLTVNYNFDEYQNNQIDGFNFGMVVSGPEINGAGQVSTSLKNNQFFNPFLAATAVDDYENIQIQCNEYVDGSKYDWLILQKAIEPQGKCENGQPSKNSFHAMGCNNGNYHLGTYNFTETIKFDYKEADDIPDPACCLNPIVVEENLCLATVSPAVCANFPVPPPTPPLVNTDESVLTSAEIAQIQQVLTQQIAISTIGELYQKALRYYRQQTKFDTLLLLLQANPQSQRLIANYYLSKGMGQQAEQAINSVFAPNTDEARYYQALIHLQAPQPLLTNWQQYINIGFPQQPDTLVQTMQTLSNSPNKAAQLMARSWLEGNLLAQFAQNLPDTTGIVHNKQAGGAALNNHSNNVLKLYPNPASSQALTIHIDASVINDADLGNLNLGFYNAVGKLVKVQGIAKNATQMVMPINQLPNGIYTCVLSTNNQTIAVQKLTIIR
jgi:tetratricopeptide (TPR) repeat protein